MRTELLKTQQSTQHKSPGGAATCWQHWVTWILINPMVTVSFSAGETQLEEKQPSIWSKWSFSLSLTQSMQWASSQHQGKYSQWSNRLHIIQGTDLLQTVWQQHSGPLRPGLCICSCRTLSFCRSARPQSRSSTIRNLAACDHNGLKWGGWARGYDGFALTKVQCWLTFL